MRWHDLLDHTIGYCEGVSKDPSDTEGRILQLVVVNANRHLPFGTRGPESPCSWKSLDECDLSNFSLKCLFLLFGGKTYFKPDCSSIVITKAFHSIHVVALQPRLKARVVCFLRIVTFSSWRSEHNGGMGVHSVGTKAFLQNANQTEAKTARPTEAHHLQRYCVTQSQQVSCFFFHFLVLRSAWSLPNAKQKAVLFGSGTTGDCLMSHLRSEGFQPLRARSLVSQAFPDHLLTPDLPAQSWQAQREGCSA